MPVAICHAAWFERPTRITLSWPTSVSNARGSPGRLGASDSLRVVRGPSQPSFRPLRRPSLQSVRDRSVKASGVFLRESTRPFSPLSDS